MRFGRTINILRAGVAWRMAGTRGAGTTLLSAVSGGDEQERMLAGMALVKAGERSVGLIEEAYEDGRATAPVVRLLTDVGGMPARALLTTIAKEPGPLGEAAIESLDLLSRIDALDETD